MPENMPVQFYDQIGTQMFNETHPELNGNAVAFEIPVPSRDDKLFVLCGADREFERLLVCSHNSAPTDEEMRVIASMFWPVGQRLFFFDGCKVNMEDGETTYARNVVMPLDQNKNVVDHYMVII